MFEAATVVLDHPVAGHEPVDGSAGVPWVVHFCSWT